VKVTRYESYVLHVELDPSEVSFLQGISSVAAKVAEVVYGPHDSFNLVTGAADFLRCLNAALVKETK